MCRTLISREGKVFSQGGKIEVITSDGEIHNLQWKGFAREESIKEGIWSNKNPVPCIIEIVGFTDVNGLHEVSDTVKCLIVDDIENRRVVKIITRAMTQDEIDEAIKHKKFTRSRPPVFLKKELVS